MMIDRSPIDRLHTEIVENLDRVMTKSGYPHQPGKSLIGRVITLVSELKLLRTQTAEFVNLQTQFSSVFNKLDRFKRQLETIRAQLDNAGIPSAVFTLEGQFQRVRLLIDRENAARQQVITLTAERDLLARKLKIKEKEDAK